MGGSARVPRGFRAGSARVPAGSVAGSAAFFGGFRAGSYGFRRVPHGFRWVSTEPARGFRFWGQFAKTLKNAAFRAHPGVGSVVWNFIKNMFCGTHFLAELSPIKIKEGKIQRQWVGRH